MIIETAPPPLSTSNPGAPQYPYLPYDYPKVIGDLGTNRVKHIYEVRPLKSPSPNGRSVRRPSQMTTLVARRGLYEEDGPKETERSNVAYSDGVRMINLTGSKPQVRTYEPILRGPFYSPNERRGLMVWDNMGLA